MSSRKNDTIVKNVVLLMVGLNDIYTKEHLILVSNFSAQVTQQYGLGPSHIEKVKFAGLLHDIGKQAIPKIILSKAGRLTPQEYELVKTHVNIGVDILEKSNVSADIIKIVSEHHERIDGSGYPKGLKGSEISIEGQILGVADIVCAHISKRTYRTAATESEIEEILWNLAPNKMSPKIVDSALQCLHTVL